ncbi:hypothetical protein BKA80DRAFT_275316 [Phyllosticta citrichinensis]
MLPCCAVACAVLLLASYLTYQGTCLFTARSTCYLCGRAGVAPVPGDCEKWKIAHIQTLAVAAASRRTSELWYRYSSTKVPYEHHSIYLHVRTDPG